MKLLSFEYSVYTGYYSMYYSQYYADVSALATENRRRPLKFSRSDSFTEAFGYDTSTA